MLIKRHIKFFLGLLCLFLMSNSEALSSCSIPTLEQLKEWGPLEAANQFYKGFFLGCSVLVIAVNIYVLAKQKSLILLTFYMIAAVFTQLLFLFGDAWASECGNAGAHASYWGYQLLAHALIFFGLILIPKPLWRKQEKIDIFQ